MTTPSRVNNKSSLAAGSGAKAARAVKKSEVQINKAVSPENLSFDCSHESYGVHRRKEIKDKVERFKDTKTLEDSLNKALLVSSDKFFNSTYGAITCNDELKDDNNTVTVTAPNDVAINFLSDIGVEIGYQALQSGITLPTKEEVNFKNFCSSKRVSKDGVLQDKLKFDRILPTSFSAKISQNNYNKYQAQICILTNILNGHEAQEKQTLLNILSGENGPNIIALGLKNSTTQSNESGNFLELLQHLQLENKKGEEGIEKLEEQASSAEKNKDKKEKICKEFEEKCKVLELSIIGNENKLFDLNKRNNKTTEEKTKQKEEIRKLKKELDTAKKELDTAKKELETAKKELETAKKELIKSRKEYLSRFINQEEVSDSIVTFLRVCANEFAKEERSLLTSSYKAVYVANGLEKLSQAAQFIYNKREHYFPKTKKRDEHFFSRTLQLMRFANDQLIDETENWNELVTRINEIEKRQFLGLKNNNLSLAEASPAIQKFETKILLPDQLDKILRREISQDVYDKVHSEIGKMAGDFLKPGTAEENNKKNNKIYSNEFRKTLQSYLTKIEKESKEANLPQDKLEKLNKAKNFINDVIVGKYPEMDVSDYLLSADQVIVLEQFESMLLNVASKNESHAKTFATLGTGAGKTFLSKVIKGYQEVITEREKKLEELKLCIVDYNQKFEGLKGYFRNYVELQEDARTNVDAMLRDSDVITAFNQCFPSVARDKEGNDVAFRIFCQFYKGKSDKESKQSEKSWEAINKFNEAYKKLIEFDELDKEQKINKAKTDLQRKIYNGDRFDVQIIDLHKNLPNLNGKQEFNGEVFILDERIYRTEKDNKAEDSYEIVNSICSKGGKVVLFGAHENKVLLERRIANLCAKHKGSKENLDNFEKASVALNEFLSFLSDNQGVWQGDEDIQGCQQKAIESLKDNNSGKFYDYAFLQREKGYFERLVKGFGDKKTKIASLRTENKNKINETRFKIEANKQTKNLSTAQKKTLEASIDELMQRNSSLEKNEKFLSNFQNFYKQELSFFANHSAKFDTEEEIDAEILRHENRENKISGAKEALDKINFREKAVKKTIKSEGDSELVSFSSISGDSLNKWEEMLKAAHSNNEQGKKISAGKFQFIFPNKADKYGNSNDGNANNAYNRYKEIYRNISKYYENPVMLFFDEAGNRKKIFSESETVEDFKNEESFGNRPIVMIYEGRYENVVGGDFGGYSHLVKNDGDRQVIFLGDETELDDRKHEQFLGRNRSFFQDNPVKAEIFLKKDIYEKFLNADSHSFNRELYYQELKTSSYISDLKDAKQYYENKKLKKCFNGNSEPKKLYDSIFKKLEDSQQYDEDKLNLKARIAKGEYCLVKDDKGEYALKSYTKDNQLNGEDKKKTLIIRAYCFYSDLLDQVNSYEDRKEKDQSVKMLNFSTYVDAFPGQIDWIDNDKPSTTQNPYDDQFNQLVRDIVEKVIYNTEIKESPKDLEKRSLNAVKSAATLHTCDTIAGNGIFDNASLEDPLPLDQYNFPQSTSPNRSLRGPIFATNVKLDSKKISIQNCLIDGIELSPDDFFNTIYTNCYFGGKNTFSDVNFFIPEDAIKNCFVDLALRDSGVFNEIKKKDLNSEEVKNNKSRYKKLTQDELEELCDRDNTHVSRSR